MVKKAQKKEAPEETSELTIPEQEDGVKVVTPLKDLVEAYVQAGDQIKAIDDGYKSAVEPLKAARESIKEEIIKVFKERGEFSARFDKATATLAVRKTVQVVDQNAAVKNLKESGLSDYVSEAPNELFHESLAKLIAKGEAKIEGVVVNEKEYLTVKTNDKDDARKITTEKFVNLEGVKNV